MVRCASGIGRRVITSNKLRQQFNQVCMHICLPAKFLVFLNVSVFVGSLQAEGGIFACSFDQTGSRLITCETDKTIKMWKEDPNAVSVM